MNHERFNLPICFQIFIGISLILSSCAPTAYLPANAIMLTDSPCVEEVKGKYIFFDYDKIDFDYEKVCFLSWNAKAGTDENEVLKHIKYSAGVHCANAVIGLKKSDYPQSKGSKIVNNSLYACTAVRIKLDSAFISKYGIGDTTDYNTITQKKAENLTGKRAGIAAVISTVFLFTLWRIISWGQ
jgi:hypothetical protein